jgi:adenosylmethionine-8-amino-7-oxononanoate aminotransferase
VTARAQVLAWDSQHVWHPYTQMLERRDGSPPLLVRSARGARLYDFDGKSYLDGNASWWACALGHQHPRLVAALKEQASELCHVALAGITHQPAAELASELVRVAPAGLLKVFYSDNGSTAVETALKLSLQYWAQNGRPERRRFLALEGAFHGETLGAVSVSGLDVFRRAFGGVVVDCLRVPPGADGHARAFEVAQQLIAQQENQLAAVIVEPLVQAAAGMRIYSTELLRELRCSTERFDVLLICDEVFTGFGRTGPLWACSVAGIAPDLLCLGKGFTGGMLPMAATLASERLFEGFLGERERTFFHGHTFCGNPLGAAVAREVLRVFEDEQVIERAAGKALRIAGAFAGFANLPGVTATRSFGMIGALDLAGGSGYLATRGQRVYRRALELGAYLRPLGNTVYITPPINVDDGELEALLGIVEESVRFAS